MGQFIRNSLFLSLILLTACKDKNMELPSANFSRYISAFTYGVVSIKSAFEIELQDNYVGTEKVGDEIKKKLFKISPSIEGRTVLKSPNKIAFIPNELLESDKAYTVDFNLEEALGEVEDDYENFNYTLRTIKESATFFDLGLEVVSETKKSKTFDYKGLIRTADYQDAKLIEEEVSINANNKIVWSHDKEGIKHNFTIKDIQATDKTQKISLDIDLENLTNSKDELEITIPNKDDFSVTSMNIEHEKQNKITIVFSEELSKTDNQGMCSIGGKFNLSSEIDGNKMIVKPNSSSEVFGDVKVKVLAGVRSKYGKHLTADYTKILNFGSQMPSVEIMGNGSIVVDNDGGSVPIKTVGLNQVKLEIHKIFQNNVLYFLQNNSLSETYNIKRFGRKVYSQVLKLNDKKDFKSSQAYNYNLDLTNLVNLEKGAIYQVRLSFDKSMTSKYGSSNQAESKNLYKFSMAQNRFDETDEEEDYYEYYYPDDYEYEKKDDPSHNSYYNYRRFSKKNILVSNIGLIAKMGTDNKIYATCIDMLTAEPLSGTMVDVFSYQFQNIGSNSTDGDGFAEISATEKPYFIVASNAGQKSYIKLDKYAAQSVDVFDVEGHRSQDGMKAFVYGERGVWRPGDKIYLTMVLSNGYDELPSDLPSQMELINPNGQVVDRMVAEKNLNGFYSFVTRTATDAPTGNWTARFKVGGLKYNKTIKIETVKPNRLRIAAENESEFIQNGDNIRYQTSWLNGASSSGLKASVDINFYSAPVKMKGYSSYIFNDKTKQFKTFEQSMYSGLTKTDGSFDFNFNMTAEASNIPGMLNAVMTTKVFENGGDFSIQYDTRKFSYYKSYVGHKMKSNSDYYLQCDRPYKLQIANLNAKGKKVLGNKVKVGLYKVEYNWWYNSYNSNRYFDRENIKSVEFEKEYVLSKGSTEVPIFIKKSGWGNYLIKVTDLSSNHSSSSFMYFESPYYQMDDAEESSQVIQMSRDKDQYKIGETAKISMVSYFEGRALLSIENGREVIDAKWFDIKTGKNEIDFKIKENMSPNVYAYVSAMQPQPNTGNNLPLRTYGIIPIHVDNSSSVLKPIIEAASKIEPESKLKITVSEANGKNMTYTLAVVDEGLLGISSYKTPNPWKFFYSKEALGVLSWDMFDEVVGAFTGVFQDVFSIGGGEEELEQMNKAKSNRYESVVKYLGPFELNGGSNNHTINVPNYVGNLKLMVVAGGKKYSFGNATKDVQVAQPLMVLGTLPRVLSIDEDVELPVNVFVTDKSIKNVSIEVHTDDKVRLIGDRKQSMRFSSVSDQITNFKIKTGNEQGITKVKIIARSGKYVSNYEMDVPIRIANPETIDIDQMTLEPGETKIVPVQTLGLPGTNKITIESSTIPELNLKSKIDELIAYPHGCLEQTTSAMFPQIYLSDLTSLTSEEKKTINTNLEFGFEKYKSFQTSSGGLSYWPNSNYINDYATAYAAHFMLEAKEKGYAINDDILKNSLRAIRSTASTYNPNRGHAYQNTYQAYRLMVLALSGKPNLGAMNRLREASLESSASIRLALAYAYAGKSNVSIDLISKVPVEIAPYIDDRYTYGSNHMDNAYLMELFLELDDRTKAFNFFRETVKALSSRRYLGTQTTAIMLRSIQKYLSKNNVAPINIGIAFNGKKYSMNGDKPSYSQELIPVNGSLKLTNNSSGTTVVNLIRKGVERIVKPISNPYLSLSIRYTDKSGKSISADRIQRQMDFKQIITVVNKSSESLYNMALTNYVPAGWEIINKRIGGANQSSGLDYQDIRDDKVLSYFSIGANQTKVISQDFNATYEGNYQVPAIILESMYNPMYKAVLGSYRTTIYK